MWKIELMSESKDDGDVSKHNAANNDRNKKRKAFFKKQRQPPPQEYSKKGLLNLPKNVETKLRKLKKALQSKSLAPDKIKEILREKRRHEENKFKKQLKSTCFKCRKPGHLINECPMKTAEEEIDICYYCGSGEHRLHDCDKYKQRLRTETDASKILLPFVQCFVCHQKGHLTRNCSDNKNGAFPKGGKCLACGSVNHTIKECVQNKKQNDEKEDISLQTYENLDQGVDVDDSMLQVSRRRSDYKPKIVKF